MEKNCPTTVRKNSRTSGFTLIEMLVVITIIGILVGILVPATQAVRASAKQTSCKNNMRQFVVACIDHEFAFRKFPKAVGANGESLFAGLLNSLDEPYLADRYEAALDAGETWEQRMEELSETPINVLFCPSSTDEHRAPNIANHGNFSTDYYGITGPIGTATSSDGEQNYSYKALEPVPSGGNVGLNGFFAPNSNGKFSTARGTESASDGAAYTIIFGEASRFALNSGGAPASRAGWAFGATYNTEDELENTFTSKSIEHPLNSGEGEINNICFSSMHNGGSHFAFIDTSVKFVNDQVRLDILKTMTSINSLEKPEKLEVE